MKEALELLIATIIVTFRGLIYWWNNVDHLKFWSWVAIVFIAIFFWWSIISYASESIVILSID